MKKISKSLQHHTFQKESYLKRCQEKDEEPDQDCLDMFEKNLNNHDHRFDDLKNRENNMEWDLLTTEWILEKVRTSDSYAQNLYAAMCNNEFIKRELWPVLKEEKWGCSWRHAGGIIADMQQKGDYIDWYCSGISNIGVYAPDLDLTEEQKFRLAVIDKYVPESHVTDEIEADLNRLGWIVVKYKGER